MRNGEMINVKSYSKCSKNEIKTYHKKLHSGVTRKFCKLFAIVSANKADRFLLVNVFF
jgi:hypothetical protein